jgi:L-threonylcarbamoyladenylate synthase
MSCSTVLSTSKSDIQRAADALSQGKLVAFPTETVYGLGADAFNAPAVARIFAVKQRPHFDPLIVHIAAIQSLARVADCTALAPAAQNMLNTLILHLWPGPLTLVLPKHPAIPAIVTAGLPTVAVRFPDHPLAQQLIRLSTGAIAAPSANPFGCLSPTRAAHVVETLGNAIDYVIDGGKTGVGVESTILDLSTGQPRILRPGGTAQESIEALIGQVAAPAPAPAITAPGQLQSHYAPRTRLSLHRLESIPYVADAAYLFFDGPSRDEWCTNHKVSVNSRVLSETGSLVEAAANLFAILHDLDKAAVSIIQAQRLPEQGLGVAVNDRLSRAAALNAHDD